LQGKLQKQNILVKGIKKRMRRHFFIHASKIVVVAQGIKDALVTDYKLPLGKIVVIPNGANLDLFRGMDKMRCRQDLGLNMYKKYICFTGNLAPWQDLKTLIEAAPRIIEKIPDVTFLIVGDGMMRNKLEATANKLNFADKFIFTGWVSHNDVPKYINSSEVCIVPLIMEVDKIIGPSPFKIYGSPQKLYEYLACEKPIVAFAIDGLDFVEERNLGFIVPSNNPTELGEALIKLLMNEELAKEMGTNGRRYVVESHSWLGVAQRISEICQQTK
jgi:glycosyltransferase involved in cell wall biosynthesis